MTALGWLLLLVGVLLGTENYSYLAVVDPRYATAGAGRVDAGGWYQAISVGLVLVGLVGGAGPPARRDPRGRKVAVGQAVGGVTTIAAALAAQSFMNSLDLLDPEVTCTYASCWPQQEQAIVLVVPMVVTGVVTVVAALMVRRTAWWVRVTGPVLTCVVSMLVQHQFWYSLLLPLFQRPPS